MSEAAVEPNPEQAKYEQMWGFSQYRKYAPGEHLVDDFIKFASLPDSAKVIDFGAGTGRGANYLASKGYKVTMLDFASNCLDPVVKKSVAEGNLEFHVQDLTLPIEHKAEYGYCTDVMEHIQPELVDDVISNILASAEKVFFQISLEDDACGRLIGTHLHLTVKPMEWWVRKMRQHKAFIYYSDKRGENAIFYVQRLEKDDLSKLNVELDQVVKNIKTNVAKGYKQLVPHQASDGKVILLGGGPSLNDYVDEIKRRAEATPVICTNGAHNWCLEHGIAPKGLVVVDGRPSNDKFVKKVSPTCKYLFASQCAPELFAKVPFDQTYIWHSHIVDYVEEELDKAYGNEMWHSVPGGTTVMLRAVPLLGMLGWKDIDIYGLDGCLREDDHHAYEQTENEGYPVVDVNVEDKTFKCHPWMVVQGQEFEKLYKATRGNIQWNVIGEGLITALIELLDRKTGVKK